MLCHHQRPSAIHKRWHTFTRSQLDQHNVADSVQHYSLLPALCSLFTTHCVVLYSHIQVWAPVQLIPPWCMPRSALRARVLGSPCELSRHPFFFLTRFRPHEAPTFILSCNLGKQLFLQLCHHHRVAHPTHTRSASALVAVFETQLQNLPFYHSCNLSQPFLSHRQAFVLT